MDLVVASTPAISGQEGAQRSAESARVLLSALTIAFGAGLPEDEWLACANALAPDDEVFGRDDVIWVLDKLGRYIVQDGEAGHAVYRIAHQSIADYIRSPFTASYSQPFDPAAGPVTAALLSRYRILLASGMRLTGPWYLWCYASRPPLLRPRPVWRRCACWRRQSPACGAMWPWRPRKLQLSCGGGATGVNRYLLSKKPSGLYRELAGHRANFPNGSCQGAKQPECSL